MTRGGAISMGKAARAQSPRTNVSLNHRELIASQKYHMFLTGHQWT